MRSAKPLLSLSLAGLTASTTADWRATAAEKADAIVRRATAADNRYTLRLTIEVLAPTAPPPFRKRTKTTHHIWRDGAKYRVDHLDRERVPAGAGPAIVPGSRHIAC